MVGIVAGGDGFIFRIRYASDSLIFVVKIAGPPLSRIALGVGMVFVSGPVKSPVGVIVTLNVLAVFVRDPCDISAGIVAKFGPMV